MRGQGTVAAGGSGVTIGGYVGEGCTLVHVSDVESVSEINIFLIRSKISVCI